MGSERVSVWPPSFDAAIFDFDGTIADTADLWRRVDEAFLGARGIECTDEYSRMLTLLGFEQGARYTIDTYHLHETVESICAEWTHESRRLYREEVRLRPGVGAYLEALRERGIPCALATTNEPEVLEAMELVDVRALFPVRLHGREVGATKDQPDIYLMAAARMGVEPGRCVVFEDIAPGLRSARGAGFQTCGVRANDPAQEWHAVRAAAHVTISGWEDLLG